MKISKIVIVLISILLITTLAGCGAKTITTTGAFSGMAYANEFFGLSFTLPDSWVTYTKDEMASALSADAAQIGSDDKEAEKKMDLSKQDVLYLAYATNHPSDYTEGNIIDFCVIAEKFNAAGKLLVKNGKDYAELAIKNNKESDPNYNAGAVTTQTINGVEFGVFDVLTTLEGYEMKQRFYCTVRNGYAVLFTTNYFEDAEMAELQPIIESISFGK